MIVRFKLSANTMSRIILINIVERDTVVNILDELKTFINFVYHIIILLCL